jgi:hypothetical protein
LTGGKRSGNIFNGTRLIFGEFEFLPWSNELVSTRNRLRVFLDERPNLLVGRIFYLRRDTEPSR